MKQKSQNRFLAALLAVAMMLQMLPMLAFADGAPGTGETYKAWIGEQGYPSLEAAVKAAKKGETTTITLGAGKYTLYKIPSDDTTKGKDLTFEGKGRGVTTWIIGPEVPDPSKYGTEYNGDYSFDGAGTVTFKNMTLHSDKADYMGFIRADHTVVENCDIDGKTFYWGYTSAVFKDTTFNAPTGDYAIWTYSSPTMTFDTCTFNASGKVINVYTDAGAGSHNITVNFENCAVYSNFSESAGESKTALNINDSNMGGYKYIINIKNPQTITAARDTTTCSQMFGYGGKAATNNKGKTDVRLDGNLIWANGEMQTHSYTDGAHDKAFTTTYSAWKTIDARNEWRDATTTCDYCHWVLEQHREVASVYRLQYNLNGGTGDETAYSDAFSHENESVTLAAAPKREGYHFDGWQTGKGDCYEAGSKLVLTGDEVFTAQWKKNEPVNHTLTVTGGTFAVKDGDIDVTDTLETSTDEASGKQTCLVPDGAEVTVTLDQTKVPEGMVFDLWSTGKFDLPLDQDYKAESITFTMNDDVDVAAQYRSADIEDGSDVVGPIIIGTAVVAGGALVGYTLGTDLVGQMWGLPYFPSNRSALAMMLWEDAGKPMPESEILYPDVGQEEQDMDLQHAARWAMEHDLLPDLNDQDTELPPEQVKFYPDNMVTKISVLRAWKKAQDLKQNAQ